MVLAEMWLCGRSTDKRKGSYPRGFIRRVKERWNGKTVIHLCGGTFKEDITADIKPDVQPTIVCDARQTPFKDSVANLVLIDPPYGFEFSRFKYNTGCPSPTKLLREGARICKPGGYVGLLHLLIPHKPADCELVAVIGVSCGPNMRIRAFTVFRKLHTLELWQA